MIINMLNKNFIFNVKYALACLVHYQILAHSEGCAIILI
jgi:hypothetical protein